MTAIDSILTSLAPTLRFEALGVIRLGGELVAFDGADQELEAGDEAVLMDEGGEFHLATLSAAPRTVGSLDLRRRFEAVVQADRATLTTMTVIGRVIDRRAA